MLIRPQVSVEGNNILLRNSLIDVLIPGKLVDELSVRSYLVLTVGKTRYTSMAVGYRPSSVARGHADLARGLVTDGGKTRVENPVAYTQDYLRSEVARIKALPGDDTGRVVRKPAWHEIALLAAILISLLISSFAA